MIKLIKYIKSFFLPWNGVFVKSHKDNMRPDIKEYYDNRYNTIRIRVYTEDKKNLNSDFNKTSADMSRAFNKTVASMKKEYSNG